MGRRAYVPSAISYGSDCRLGGGSIAGAYIHSGNDAYLCSKTWGDVDCVFSLGQLHGGYMPAPF